MKQTGSEQNDMSNTTDRQNSNFETELIENTPFMRVEKDGKHFAIIAGKRVTEFYNTKQELLDKVNERNWDLITCLVGVMISEQEAVQEIYNTK